MDQPTDRLIRRYEHARPSDLVHLDVKKQASANTAAGGEPMAVKRGKAGLAASDTPTCIRR